MLQDYSVIIESLYLPNPNSSALLFHVSGSFSFTVNNNGDRRKRSAGTNVAHSTPDSAGLGKQGIHRTDDLQHKENNGFLERIWCVTLHNFRFLHTTTSNRKS